MPAARRRGLSYQKQEDAKVDRQLQTQKRVASNRERYHSNPAARDRQIQHSMKWSAQNRMTWRDIGEFPLSINWERRLACKQSLKLFDETYLPEVFDMGWSQDQLACVGRIEKIKAEGGKFTVAMPRAGGKTANVRGGILWMSVYNFRRFIFNIGSREDSALATLNFVLTHLENNPLIMQDFPELSWPFRALNRSNHLARGQTYMGTPTHINRADDHIVFPYLLLPQDIAAHYQENDPDSVRKVPPDPQNPEKSEKYVNANGGIILRSSGIDGAIRGEADADPIFLNQPRPDLVILDDIQKDHKADSPIQCEKMIRLVDGAVTGLAGKGQHIDILMPCTVIREGDVADTYLNPLLKPDFQGLRFKMVTKWPDGITDFEMDKETEAGDLWIKYAQVRRDSLRSRGNISLATELYAKNRKKMDKGFEVSWELRYEKRPGGNVELSAQQHAMNLRLQNPQMFLSEYQNIGRRLIETSEVLITADQLAKKQSNLKRGEIAAEHQYIVDFVDVQDEILYVTHFATDQDFNGTFFKYQCWPDPKQPYFTKSQTATWGMITSKFFEQFPKYKSKAFRNSAGKIRAPLEPKIYWALTQVCTMLLQEEYVKQDAHKSRRKVNLILIDARWGQASEVIKRFIREFGDDKIKPYMGHDFPPTQRQLEEYERRPGWFFEDMLHPNVREPKWVWRPNAGNGELYMQADVNRGKDFLMARLATPPGAPGCINLHRAPTEFHELFANHICTSEYPEPVAARGISKNMWTVREGTGYDNDFLDGGVGCIMGASALGASLKTSDEDFTPKKRSFSAIHQSKRSGTSPKSQSQAPAPRLRLSRRS